MAEMFPTRMRYSGVSLGYQVTAIVAGSWAPLIATALLRETGSWIPIAWYILFAGAISLGSALYMRESKGVSLLAIDEEDVSRMAEENATGPGRQSPNVIGEYALSTAYIGRESRREWVFDYV